MNVTRATYAGAVALLLVTTGALGFALTRDGGAPAKASVPTSTAPVVQLGAPGRPNRTLSPDSAAPSTMPHTAADVAFMQGMVAHHEQALAMTALTRTHTRNAEVATMAERMDVSQRDEIVILKSWLGQNSASPSGMPTASGGHAGHGMATPAPSASASASSPGMAHTMPGMLTGPELAQLGAARDGEFDRLFLQYMIRHHEGAISMVEELLTGGEGGQASDVFLLAQHMSSDQGLEIARMKSMLAKS